MAEVPFFVFPSPTYCNRVGLLHGFCVYRWRPMPSTPSGDLVSKHLTYAIAEAEKDRLNALASACPQCRAEAGPEQPRLEPRDA